MPMYCLYRNQKKVLLASSSSPPTPGYRTSCALWVLDFSSRVLWSAPHPDTVNIPTAVCPALIIPLFSPFPQLNSFTHTATSISKMYLETTLLSSFTLQATSISHPDYNTLLAGHAVSILASLQPILHIAGEVIILKRKSSTNNLLLKFFSGFPFHYEKKKIPALCCEPHGSA